MNRNVLGISAGCFLAAVMGYLLARRPSSNEGAASESSAGVSSSLIRSATAGSDRRDSQTSNTTLKQRGAKQLTALKDDLSKRFSSSPSAIHDWALREQTAGILATMSTKELEEFAKELAPPAGVPIGLTDWQPTLMREVCRQWGLKDPKGACLGLADTGWGHGEDVFRDWLKRDPAAAQTWMDSGDFPPNREELATSLRMGLIYHQAVTDFPSARESLNKLDPEAQKKMLLSWSGLLALDPARRADLLTLLAARQDGELSEKIHQKMVLAMADKSPADAAAYVEESDLSEDMKDKLSHQVLGEWAMKQPTEAFAKWAELKEDSAPAPLLNAMDNWCLNSPGTEQAIAWVMKLEQGPAREQFEARLINHMASFGRFKQAAELGSTIANADERIRQLKIVKRHWQERSPQYANEWFAKLPPEDRDMIEGK